MEIGIIGKEEIVVNKDVTAAAIGSGMVEVFATPMMIALMENTCAKSVASHLQADESTVGTHVNVSHCAATPIGMKVYCESELIEIDRRKLTFKVTAYDERGMIGEGLHERFIIDSKKFQAKINSK
jgi:predicted thioesterase